MTKLIQTINAKQKAGTILDRVKTFEDACRELGISPNNLHEGTVDEVFSKDVKSIEAYMKLIIIVRALNEGWQPDWNDVNQRKYFPWFSSKASGFGFTGTGYANWSVNTGVGSRLCFKSAELAEYAGKQFEGIYNEFFIIQQ